MSAADRAATADEAGTVRVRLLGLRPDAVRHSQQYNDALVRELELMVKGSPDDVGVDHESLGEDLARIRAATSVFRPLLEAELVALFASGAEEGDVVLEVPRQVCSDAAAADAVFDRAEARCGGSMLLPRPPERASGMRRWFFAQFVDQAAGRPPVRWTDWWARRAGAAEEA